LPRGRRFSSITARFGDLPNFACGRDIIADCVNDWQSARDGWDDVGRCIGIEIVWMAITCSDAMEHRRRVETPTGDVPGLTLPDWEAVRARDFHHWKRAPITIDTANPSITECVKAPLRALGV